MRVSSKSSVATCLACRNGVHRRRIKCLIFRHHVIALRLYPQLPVNVRFAIRPTILPRGGGPDGLSPVLIDKGTGLGWSSYHLHRREDIYGPDACVYRPERWEGGRLSHEVAQTGAFLDFHAGPRVCLGSTYFQVISCDASTDVILKFSRGLRYHGS